MSFSLIVIQVFEYVADDSVVIEAITSVSEVFVRQVLQIHSDDNEPEKVQVVT